MFYFVFEYFCWIQNSKLALRLFEHFKQCFLDLILFMEKATINNSVAL